MSNPTTRQGPKTFATLIHDPVLLDWAKHRDLFLDELLCLDGWCGADCTRCATRPCNSARLTEFHCEDCMGGSVQWNRRFFEATTLQSISLVIQLGHLYGEVCLVPTLAPRSFTVIDTNGFHSVTVQFCEFDHQEQAGTRLQQLLRYELYSATFDDPSTCCTFHLMETFHLLTLQSKVTVYDFYLFLQKTTNCFGLQKPFLVKSAGRGHESGGVLATKLGELCLQCPACPQPDVNLPPNWECISDNLKLKCRAISNEACDPSMLSGWGYCIEGSAYREHLKNRHYRGYATTGIAMAIDVQHGFILPNGVGDLQKSERYCNMDFISMSALSLQPQPTTKKGVVLSYDIMCQYLIWLHECIKNLLAHIQIELPIGGEVQYVISKYHLNTHKKQDHNKYSLNFMKGCGQTDGKEVERGWSCFDGTTASTWEMGPGLREEMLEDHLHWNNEEKYIDLGAGPSLCPNLHKRKHTAVASFSRFNRAHQEFVQELQPSHVAKWDTQILMYKADSTLPDPYYCTLSGMSKAEIWLKLAQEEENTANNGHVMLHEITPATIIANLMDLEEQQRKFRKKYPLNMSGTPLQTAEAIAKHAALRHHLNTARTVQMVYMPRVSMRLAKYCQWLASSGNTLRRLPPAELNKLNIPELQPLFLPSELDERELHGLNKLQQNEIKITAFKDKYRSARQAKLAIVGPGPWEQRWKVLQDQDVVTLHGDDEIVGVGTSEGKQELSWIWKGTNGEGDPSAWNISSQGPEGAGVYAAKRATVERGLCAWFNSIWARVPDLALTITNGDEDREMVVSGGDGDGFEVHFTLTVDADSDDDGLCDLVDTDEE
ncbi:uncharacterized protein PHACADRAFT_33448 [Phanerochaete carnosa HHB-10118-sp]|uniref:CxC2-like cysteine cluster KDZ transposase-associated domain-containing protein n=1 Tax=Phanerochaete carnosa (strain HHB-10118-sp) TaxID=650164 RepID=K5VE33_PHACS|nr:uncharacterized protein PHACADRAFT_33448 [Phanerochaete carnosa HHB-10118-sp]EKM49373.1 hypothetical protein PHACADRAFT_33448 [Phanerochaete carnosa HHB-10118-sp]